MSSELFGIIQKDTEIKSSAEKFHEIFNHRPHHVSNASSKVHACTLHEGVWGTEGSIVSWTYIHDGKTQFIKQIIETVDDEKKSMTFKVIEGDVMDYFENFIIYLQVTPKADGEGGIVHWRIEYMKRDEIVDPHPLLEEHLLEAA